MASPGLSVETPHAPCFSQKEPTDICLLLVTPSQSCFGGWSAPHTRLPSSCSTSAASPASWEPEGEELRRCTDTHRFIPQERPFEARNGSQGRRGHEPHGRANLRAGRGGWRSRVRIRWWGGSCSPFEKGMRQLSTSLEQGPQKGRSRVWEKLFPLGTLEKRGGTQAGRTEGRGASPMLGLHVQTFYYRVGGWQDQPV